VSNKEITIKVHGNDVTVVLTQEDERSRFPSWLKERTKEWTTVNVAGKYLGEVFLINGEWKAFDTSVVQVDGTFEGALLQVVRSN